MRRRRLKIAAPTAACLAVAAMLFAPAVSAQRDALIAAARAGDAETAQEVLAAGGDPDSASPDGTTALHWAAYNGDAALVADLLEAGADPNVRNDYGSTPLMQAATIGSADVVGALLDAGADVNAAGREGQTPLMAVARTNALEAARLLLAAGADVNARESWREQTALMWAAAQGQAGMVTVLLEHGADPNLRSAVNDWTRQVSAERRRMYRPFGGLTALIYAAREGCVECARALVAGGADPDLSDPRGVTPLIVAIDNLHFDVAGALIDGGASLHSWDWWGRSPLYMAVDMNTLPQGGRPDRRSTSETTSLELIERLLALGADPNLQLKLIPPYRNISDDRGCDQLLTTGTTPLLRAAKTFDVAAIGLLIEAGADLELPNEDGVTPVMAAAGYGSLECDIRGYGAGIPHYQTPDVEQASVAALEPLIDAGADVNARTTGGRRGAGQTALFGAAFWGWNDVVDFLVEHGARIDVADAEGRTPVAAALGQAGGHIRGSTTQVFEATAARLTELCAARSDCDLEAPERWTQPSRLPPR